MANIIGTTGNNTLNGTANDDFIFGDAGNDTLNGNGGNDILVGGYGLDKMYGGAGNDEFWVGGTEIVAGEIIDGGTGTNTISTWGGDLSLATITNVQRLGFHLTTLKLKASQLAAFSDLVAYNATPVTLTAASAGTYSLNGKNVTGVFNLTGSSGNDVLAGNGAAQTLTGGDGNDVLQGLGGADKMYGGNGDDEFLVGGDEVAAGEIIDGGAGNNKISTWGGDLSKATITNVQTLGMHLDKITLSAAQLASFTNLIAYDGVPVTLQAASAGTYDLTFKPFIGTYNLVGSSGDDVLKGYDGILSIHGGNGNDFLKSSGRGLLENLYGDDGDDTIFIYGYPGTPLTGSIIDGGSGNNTLSGDFLNITDLNVLNFQTLAATNSVILNPEQLVGFKILSGYFAIYGATAGTYDFSKITDMGTTARTFYCSDNSTTVIGNNTLSTIEGGAGDDIIYGGNGNNAIYSRGGKNILYGEGGDDVISIDFPTVNKVYGGDGDDAIQASGISVLPAGSIIDGGSGYNTLRAFSLDISSAIISNVQKFSFATSITLTASQLDGFSELEGFGPINAANAGTYSLVSKSNTFSLNGSAENDTLVGNGGAQTLTGNAGNDTLDGKAGADSLIGGTGNDTYVFGLGYGADSITENDATAGNTDIVSLLSGTARDQLWFTKSGNDLQMKIIGTSDSVTLKDWYIGSAYHVEQFKTAAGNTLLDSKVQNLVNAMAGLAVPSTTTLTAAYHTQLDSVIAANWT